MDDFTRQASAYAALTKLMEDARACRTLFEEAGVPAPEILLRFFVGPHGGAAPKVVVPRMQPPPKPAGWKESWIWVPLKDATVVTVVRCVLQSALRPLGPSEIYAEVKKHRPETSSGTVNNIGTRLEGSLIERNNGEWRAIDKSQPPVMHAGHAWGPPEDFENYDIACHRRMAVEHVLRAHSDGMLPMQLLKALESCQEWLKVPVNKDLLKLDLETLDDAKRIHRRGNTAKWTVTEGPM